MNILVDGVFDKVGQIVESGQALGNVDVLTAGQFVGAKHVLDGKVELSQMGRRNGKNKIEGA